MLHLLWCKAFDGLPYQVNVVTHNYKTVYYHTFFIYQEPKTVNNDFFVHIISKQVFPF